MMDISSNTAPETALLTDRLPSPPRAAKLLHHVEDKRLYWDRSHYSSPASQMEALSRSCTVYVGNLAFRTRSRQIRAHFGSIGTVVAVQMGLDRVKKTPCGFCFVEYQFRADALAAVQLLTNTKLDGRVIRVELDAGFQPGRQYGRGVSGGQVRDDKRRNQDDADRRSATNVNSYNKRNRDDNNTGLVDINAPLSAPRAGDHTTHESQSDGGGGGDDAGTNDEEMEPETKRRRTST